MFFTAEPTVAAVVDPPEVGVGGRSLSPSSNFTFAKGNPSASAATWVITV